MSEHESERVWDLIIVGAGPAGMAAAIYAGRARLNTLILEGMMPGGQVVLNEVIENYPGFPEGVAGWQLGQLMSEQATRFGAQHETALVESIDSSERPFRVHTSNGVRLSRTILITTGSSPRRLGVPGEKEYFARGVSYCATCDGPLYGGKQVMVVGGGNTALGEALFLAPIASNVVLVHRRDEFRGDRILRERVLQSAKIRVLWDSVLTSVIGNEVATGAKIHNLKTGEEQTVAADAIFIAIGTTPRAEFLPPEVVRDEMGFVLVDEHLMTTMPGIFAAGDVRLGTIRQITFAVGDGTLAYHSVLRYLEENQ